MAAAVAIKGLGNGKTAYGGCFADAIGDGVGFSAAFDPEVARAYEAQGRQVPTWTLDLEKDFYTSFVALRTPAYLMRWTVYEQHGNDEIDSVNGLAVLHRKYEVFLLDASNTTVGQIAVGITDLSFQRIGSRWAITSWVDLVDPAVGANPANSDLRSFSYRRLEGR
jgi:hypothetical protein